MRIPLVSWSRVSYRHARSAGATCDSISGKAAAVRLPGGASGGNSKEGGTMAGEGGQLEGRVAVVTGGSRGIGEAIAVRYAMEGARVALAARTVNEGDHRLLSGSLTGVAARIEAAGGEALGVACNLFEAADRERLIETTEAELGPVDILVNNGAVTWYSPIDAFDPEKQRVMVEVQVHAAVHLSQLVADGMSERGWGAIVNMSSGAALHPELGAATHGGTIYGMCKAALERFSTGFAAEQPAIAVNAIQPGLIATPGVEYFGIINDENRHRVTPVEHVAEACLRLAVNEPSMISGRIVTTAEVLEEFDLTPAELP
ncbi:MAG: SDR family oxidoreductase [Chloroflexi bacterium]|nr:SDR family oxidoreductase [Chloroflexota bacterium]